MLNNYKMLNKPYKVVYRGQMYSFDSDERALLNSLYLFNGSGNSQGFIKNIYSLPALIDNIFYSIETEDNIYLYREYMIFNEDLGFEIEKDVIIEYDKQTKDYEQYYDIEKDIYNNRFTNEANVHYAITLFALKVIKNKNVYLFEELKDNKIADELYHINKDLNSSSVNANLTYNLLNVALKFDIGFEKLLKSQKKLILNNLVNNKISLNNDGKLSQVIELPQFVIDYINDKKLQSIATPLQKLDIDGNSYRIILDFLDNSNTLVKASKREDIYTQFLDVFAEIVNDYDYSIKPLLGHLIKEAFFRPVKTKSRHYYRYRDSIQSMEFPLNEALLMRDYLNMCDMNNLKAVKYPYIEKDHNITMKNLTSLKDVNEEEFMEAVNEYKDLAELFNSQDYTLITPDSVKSMIEEGNQLHHCVASYTTNVLNKNSKIFFLRDKNDINSSLVTIELSKDNRVNHVKAAYNQDPSPDIMRLITIWSNKL